MTTTNDTMGDVISSEKVEGTSEYNAVGDKLGSIDDLMIDKMSGQVRYAVMEFGGFLGMDTDRYPIPWKMLKYDTDLDGYVVPIDKTKTRKRPSTHWIAFRTTIGRMASASMDTTALIGNPKDSSSGTVRAVRFVGGAPLSNSPRSAASSST